MSTYRFEVVIEEDKFEDGGEAYHAYCPALPGCRTWGHTYEEAEANVREAVSLYVEDLQEFIYSGSSNEPATCFIRA